MASPGRDMLEQSFLTAIFSKDSSSFEYMSVAGYNKVLRLLTVVGYWKSAVQLLDTVDSRKSSCQPDKKNSRMLLHSVQLVKQKNIDLFETREAITCTESA
jgi:hypothetical protein